MGRIVKTNATTSSPVMFSLPGSTKMLIERSIIKIVTNRHIMIFQRGA